MPNAPPSSREVSFTAEPTPAFESGTEVMIRPVAGATVMATPAPSNATAAANNGYARVGRQRGQHAEPSGDDGEPERHHAGGAKALRERGAAWRDRDQRDCGRQCGEARLERGVPAGELEVLRHEEEEAEHHEERGRDDAGAGAEATVAEQGQRQHRVVTSPLPGDEGSECNAGDDERGKHTPTRPSVLRTLDDGEDQRAHADERQEGTDRVERRLRVVARVRSERDRRRR